MMLLVRAITKLFRRRKRGLPAETLAKIRRQLYGF